MTYEINDLHLILKTIISDSQDKCLFQKNKIFKVNIVNLKFYKTKSIVWKVIARRRNRICAKKNTSIV